ncbi:MAG: MBL fold metallo-hydrolase [Ruminococcaceae bacterium]|nr:MBL fold metallo-hydrolase [Oscillospiraceae bacterium]
MQGGFDMEYVTLTVGELATNCYLVWGADKQAAVIDPGDEAERILAAASARGLTVRAVMLTHLHIDHFLALPALLEKTGARFVLPQEELPALDDSARNLMNWIAPAARFTLPRPTETVGEGDTVTVGQLTFTVWHTPGHTAGSSCYRCEDTLFCGDTLFQGSVGRCDLPSGNGAVLMNTLARLAVVTEDMTLLAGHGPATTLFDEQKTNPYLK